MLCIFVIFYNTEILEELKYPDFYPYNYFFNTNQLRNTSKFFMWTDLLVELFLFYIYNDEKYSYRFYVAFGTSNIDENFDIQQTL